MKYPKDYLDEIKLRLKVSQVVGKYVQLKKRGKQRQIIESILTEEVGLFFCSSLFYWTFHF